MLNNLKARRDLRREDGFTLIELLIVIVILGILAAIVVFSVRGITDRGDESACKANIKAGQVAVEAYYAQESRYPTSMGNLTTEDASTTPPSRKFLQEALPAGYINFGANPQTEPTYKNPSTC